MALTFYYGSGSPFAWRVWLALEFKGIPYEQKTMSFSSGDLKKPEFSAINPRHRVPTIVDDGYALYESVAIIEYLDERFANGPKLFPGDMHERGRIRRLIQEADQYFLPAADPMLDQVMFSPKETWDEASIAKAREKFAREISSWERYVEFPWLAGQQMSAADLTLYPMIAFILRLEKKKPDIDIRGLIGPKFGAWMRNVEALPYLDKTIPPHWKS